MRKRNYREPGLANIQASASTFRAAIISSLTSCGLVISGTSLMKPLRFSTGSPSMALSILTCPKLTWRI